ncbi:hypothetical protein CRG98_041666 [Punica granatum]|uniref:Uncharacterized protein n=1 Tax=Punica granatum TaxID=22663 RepID=A0A2I0I2A3_PUNGR|nr:hypothetical protein CRG98_041666 [Punica granatum]
MKKILFLILTLRIHILLTQMFSCSWTLIHQLTLRSIHQTRHKEINPVRASSSQPRSLIKPVPIHVPIYKTETADLNQYYRHPHMMMTGGVISWKKNSTGPYTR